MFEEILDPADRVRAICEFGCSVDIDTSVSATKYMRSGHMIIKMADVYADEKNFESAFILYSKFITLFVEKLPSHPDYSSLRNVDRNRISKDLKYVFDKAERTKKLLIELCRRDVVERERRQAKEQERRLQEEQILLDQQHEKDKQEHNDFLLAMKMNEEQMKNTKISASTTKPPVSSSVDPLKQTTRRSEPSGYMSTTTTTIPTSPSYDFSPPTSDPSIRRPRLPSSISLSSGQLPSDPPTSSSASYTPMPPYATTQPPSVDRASKPSSTCSSHFASSSGSLRMVNVPERLTAAFLRCADSNNIKNHETCGILCGYLRNNEFTITTVIIPKQTGSPDSCDMLNEEELFDVQDSRNLITLGWIHTHPSQTAFLSSVDLHTQASYQSMLPEALAIVCSVKYNQIGYFSLTSSFGLHEILQCKRKGFHPHTTDPPIFAQSNSYRIGSELSLEIIDLRN